MPNTEWGPLVRRYRIERCLTPTQLGRQLRVHFTTVFRYESGHEQPSLAQQRRLRDMFYRQLRKTELAELMHDVKVRSSDARILVELDTGTILAVSPAHDKLLPAVTKLIGVPARDKMTEIVHHMYEQEPLKKSSGIIGATIWSNGLVRFPGHTPIPNMARVSYRQINGRKYGIVIRDWDTGPVVVEHYEFTRMDELLD